MIRIEGNKSALYQWDLNRRVILTNIKEGIQVHFSHEHVDNSECPVLLSYKENENVYANIPNIFLQKSGIITVYIYVQESEEAYTEYHTEILVLSRPKPSDYIYTETEILCYSTLLKRIEHLETAGGAINGIPSGGKAGQLLCKKSDDDYDVEWTDLKIPEQYGLVTYDQDKVIKIT